MISYALALGISHYFVIAPRFNYLGFDDVPPSVPAIAVVVLPYVLCARQLPASWDRPSALVYWMLFLLVVAPIHVLPVFVKHPTSSVWLMVGSVAGCFWLLGLMYSIEPFRFPRFVVPHKFYWTGFLCVWAALFGLVAIYYGLEFRLVSLDAIYQVREQFKEAKADVPRFARYAIPWLGSVIAPIALARGLLYRRWLYAIAAVVTEILLVAITGYKSLLFSSLLIVLVLLTLRFTDPRRIGTRVAMLAASGVLVSTLIDYVFDTTMLTSLFVRRMVLVAAVNTKYFFEFFSEFPKLHLGHSVLGTWVNYPYDLRPANLIGMVYYGNPWTSANANLWADAYENFGLTGMVVFTAILAVVLLGVDSCARMGAPRKLALAVLAMPAIGLSNSALLTVLMTHGLLLAAALVYLMPPEPPPKERRATATRAQRRVSANE